MKIGITLPQGCDREYLGLGPELAWERTVEAARQAEALGFESLWVYDHFQVDPPPEEAIVFEPFVELAALAMATSRARLGHLVLAAAYRNAALTAKAISTLDVISGGRVELGIGAGWKEDEWLAYGYGFPGAPVCANTRVLAQIYGGANLRQGKSTSRKNFFALFDDAAGVSP